MMTCSVYNWNESGSLYIGSFISGTSVSLNVTKHKRFPSSEKNNAGLFIISIFHNHFKPLGTLRMTSNRCNRKKCTLIRPVWNAIEYSIKRAISSQSFGLINCYVGNVVNIVLTNVYQCIVLGVPYCSLNSNSLIRRVKWDWINGTRFI